jgi:nitroreductase
MLDALSLLQQRHSAPSRQLGEPAPDAATLRKLLEAAVRVPDHGKLKFGALLAERAIRRDPELPESKREKERLRYTFAPLVIAVIARIDHAAGIPEIEQKLCAGNVAYNILLGAYALGFGAQWLTGWAAYDAEVASVLGLAAHENVIGFVHIGTPQTEIPDRERPALANLLTEWKG